MTTVNNKKSKKRGRPKIPKERRHLHIVPIRFKDEELKLFSRAAKSNKQTLSGWIRTRLRVPWDQIADLDAETLAVNRKQAEEATRVLKDNKIEFWQLGPLSKVCSRPDHQQSED